jgi:hypothetical protein
MGGTSFSDLPLPPDSGIVSLRFYGIYEMIFCHRDTENTEKAVLKISLCELCASVAI